MSKGLIRGFEALLVLSAMASIAFGATWLTTSAQPAAPIAEPTATLAAQPIVAQQNAQLPTIVVPTLGASSSAINDVLATSTPGIVEDKPLATAVPFDPNKSEYQVEPGDAPLLKQAQGTLNFLLLGSDATADNRFARTDSLIVASVNPDIPSVSMLSFPRDIHVKIPGIGEDRINTAFEYGYANNFPGGGPQFLALVLRKNFGIKIDHFVRIDFAGFIKAIDTLGGIEVLAECELHDTFPDKDGTKLTPKGRASDLDVLPGKIKLNGKQALWYSRSRWSTSDFDRARRQQKVLRAVLRKAKQADLLQNGIGLFNDFRSNIETDLGVSDLPTIIDLARRLDDVTIKNSVVTFPYVRTLKRKEDGALVLQPQDGILSFISVALAPPAGNRAANRIGVEVYNGSNKPDMELVAAERMTWEGFLVVGSGKLEERFKETQIIDYGTSRKDSPVPRLAGVFNVKNNNIIGQADPSSASKARIILGDDYDSCPNTYYLAADVVVEPSKRLIPTPTP